MLTRCLASISLLVVVTAGCSSSSSTGASAAAVSVAPTSVAASPTVSPTPSATPFVSSGDEAGAHAFVLAYYAELNRAFATGDTSRLAVYRLGTCSCLKFDNEIRTAHDAGGSIDGAKIVVTKWVYGDHGPAFAKAAVAFSFPTITTRIPGKPDVVEAALRIYHVLDLRRQGGAWVISDIRYKAADS
jgi:hypothetical protein